MFLWEILNQEAVEDLTEAEIEGALEETEEEALEEIEEVSEAIEEEMEEQKCMMQHAATAVNNVRFHSDQQEASQFYAAIVSAEAEIQEIVVQEIVAIALTATIIATKVQILVHHRINLTS